MADARRLDAWSHTSAVMALLANINRNPKKRPSPFSPAEFNPYAVRSAKPKQKVSVRVLKDVFVKGSPRKE